MNAAAFLIALVVSAVVFRRVFTKVGECAEIVKLRTFATSILVPPSRLAG